MVKRGIDGRAVYSTDPGFIPPCKVCGETPPGCRCASPPPSSPPGPARVRLERKGRGGKAVTLIEGLPGSPENLGELLRELKQALATGGSLKERTLELQGDQRDRALKALEKRGFSCRRG